MKEITIKIDDREYTLRPNTHIHRKFMSFLSCLDYWTSNESLKEAQNIKKQLDTVYNEINELNREDDSLRSIDYNRPESKDPMKWQSWIEKYVRRCEIANILTQKQKLRDELKRKYLNIRLNIININTQKDS